MPKLTPGAKAWCALAGGVLAWDLAAPDQQMLSHAFRRGCSTRRGRLLLGGLWLALTLHLFALVPPHLDPFHAVHLTRGRVRR